MPLARRIRPYGYMNAIGGLRISWPSVWMMDHDQSRGMAWCYGLTITTNSQGTRTPARREEPPWLCRVSRMRLRVLEAFSKRPKLCPAKLVRPTPGVTGSVGWQAGRQRAHG